MSIPFGTVFHGPVAIVNINCKVLTEDANNLAETFKECFHVRSRGKGLTNISGAIHQSQYYQFKNLLEIAVLDYKADRLKQKRAILQVVGKM